MSQQLTLKTYDVRSDPTATTFRVIKDTHTHTTAHTTLAKKERLPSTLTLLGGTRAAQAATGMRPTAVDFPTQLQVLRWTAFPGLQLESIVFGRHQVYGSHVHWNFRRCASSTLQLESGGAPGTASGAVRALLLQAARRFSKTGSSAMYFWVDAFRVRALERA